MRWLTQPTWMLLTYLTLLFTLPAGLVITPLGAAGSPASVFGIGCLLLWVAAHADPRWAPGRRPTPVKGAMYLFALAVVVSYILASMRGLPVAQQSGADRALLTVASWTGVVFVCVDFVRTRADLDRVLRALLYFAAALAVVGLVQFTTGFDLASLYHIPGLTQNTAIAQITERSIFARVQGTASHAIEFGVVLGTVFPFALHHALYDRSHRTRWTVVTGLIVVGAAISISRSAVICLVVSTVVLFTVWSGPRRIAALMVAPVVVVALRLLVPGLVGTMLGLFSAGSKDPSIQGRLDDYVTVGILVDQHPWFGRGIGTFLPKDFFVLDNQYLGTVIETGYLGLGALAVLLVVGMGLGRGARLRARDEASAHLGQAFVAAFAALALAFATFDALAFPMISGVGFLLLGCAGANWRLAVQEHGFTARRTRLRPPVPTTARRPRAPLPGSTTR